jgi:hypothetical protein
MHISRLSSAMPLILGHLVAVVAAAPSTLRVIKIGKH